MPAVWDREEPLLFLPTDDGAGYRVSAAPGADFREAVIPAEYNGLPVLEIAACGFNGCDSLEAVTFPDSIVKIGTKAFAECSSLKEIQVPEGVTEIGPYAFAWCSGLERAVIPGSVSCLSEGTFYGDTALTDIRMEEGIGEVRFRAFGYCTSLKSVEFPDSVAFMDQPLYICESLEHIRLPENVTYYGDSYEGGSRLMSICLEVHYLDFPDTVTRIGGAAFSLPRLKEMVIPAGLEAIYFNAGDFSELERFFYKGTEKQWTGIAAQYPQATVLDEINFPVYFYSEEQPAKLGRYWHYEEGHAVIWTYPDEGFMYLLNRDRTGYVVSRAPGADISGTLVIPDSYEGLPVTDIDICGFQGCSGVTTVVIPDSVVRIGKRAFWGCTGIREMMIPEGVEEIGAEAFAYCTNLRRLALPSGLYRVRLNMITLDETLSFIEIPENAVLLDGFRIYYPWEIPDQTRPFPADTVILPSGLLANLCHALRIYPNTEELVEPAQIKTIFYRGDPLQLENEISALNATWRNLLDFWETTFYCYSETEPEEEGLFWHYENGQAQPWE